MRTCRYCAIGSAVETEFNQVEVDTGGLAPTPQPRLTATTSSCGLCGAVALDDLRERLHPAAARSRPSTSRSLASMPGRASPAPRRCSGGPAASTPRPRVDRTGTPVHVREDIGRHNAVDKVVGRLLLDGDLPASDLALYASGRASFEIVQKAWAAGLPAVVAVSAPVGARRRRRRAAPASPCAASRASGAMNVYTHPN